MHILRQGKCSSPDRAYRPSVYTVKLQTAVYVLHAFQKKSHRGIATSQQDIEMIKRRLKWACEIDAEALQSQLNRPSYCYLDA